MTTHSLNWTADVEFDAKLSTRWLWVGTVTLKLNGEPIYSRQVKCSPDPETENSVISEAIVEFAKHLK